MSQVITHPLLDGVAVTIPAPGVPIELVMARDIPEGVSRAVINRADLPDRYFRNAWEYDGPKGVKVNIKKAKEVQRNKWREMRKSKLAELDVELMQALEVASTAKRKEVADKKQALRDVTLTELPNDLEAIRQTIPEILI